jgi:hypothetical protein
VTINEYLATYKDADGKAPKITCCNGLVLSVQAHARAYCEPRSDIGPYSEVEVGGLSKVILAVYDYAENKKDLLGTTYPYVPVEVVEAVIKASGGIA